MICRTFGRYIARFSWDASSARHVSRTSLRSSGTDMRSLQDIHRISAPQTWLPGCDDEVGHARHVDIERGKCSHSCVEVIAQTHIDVADLRLGHLQIAPESERFEELLDCHEQTRDRRLDSRLGAFENRTIESGTGTYVCVRTTIARGRGCGGGRVRRRHGVVVPPWLVPVVRWRGLLARGHLFDVSCVRGFVQAKTAEATSLRPTHTS